MTGDLLENAVTHRQSLASVLDVSTEESSEGELAAMVSYAIAFPDGFMALVDTYDVKRYFAFRQILSEQLKEIIICDIFCLNTNNFEQIFRLTTALKIEYRTV